jgi:cyanophycinase
MAATHLIGGGRREAAERDLWGPFLAEAASRAAAAGRARPVVAVVLADDGDGEAFAGIHDVVLSRVAPCAPDPVLVPPGGTLDPDRLSGADAVLMGGGLTPAYQEMTAPVREALTGLLAARDLPYAGFSAGAAIAARGALVGGRFSRGAVVCPADAAEDLDEIEVRPGLGLVPWTVEAHAAQWGTLPRLMEAVARGLTPHGSGVAVDEDTVLRVDGAGATVHGLGRVHLVRATGDGAVTVRAFRPGERVDTGPWSLPPA